MPSKSARVATLAVFLFATTVNASACPLVQCILPPPYGNGITVGWCKEHPCPIDTTVLDDLVVQASMCVGEGCVDCTTALSATYPACHHGFDKLAIRGGADGGGIRYQDTSNTASFPSRDWRLAFNRDGDKKFAVEDVDGNTERFIVEDTGSIRAGPVRITKSNQFEITRSAAHVETTPVGEAKENEVLAKIASLDLKDIFFLGGSTERHLGPLAETFNALFPEYSTPETRASVDVLDMFGVSLAAIKALNRKINDLQAQVDGLSCPSAGTPAVPCPIVCD